MIVDVFVSLDGINYNNLDLENVESIPMKYVLKDTQDIAKVFSPYSLGFTFQATPKNLRTLGYFGNTDVYKVSDLRKLKCKIYVNSLLNQTGLLKLEKIAYKMGKPEVITASFVSNLTDLGKRIGDDTIDMLDNAVVNWLPNNVYNSLQSITSINTSNGTPLKYYTPLASINRVWQYDDTPSSTELDNIYYLNSSAPSSEKVIQVKELRPAISFSSIFDLIKKKYNLDVIIPLESRNEYTDLYAWCMNETLSAINETSKFVLKTNLGAESLLGTPSPPTPTKYTITSSILNNSFKIVRNRNENEWSKFVQLRLIFENINFLADGEKKVTITFNKLGNPANFFTQTFDINDGITNVFTLKIDDAFLVSDEIEFQINTSFSLPCTWSNVFVQFKYNYRNTVTNSYTSLRYQSNTNNNNLEMNTSRIDLIKSLPKIKVIDFLKSFLKSFNIAILDITPDNESLYFYTPEDILLNNKTPIYKADISNVDKSIQDDFNYYIFKHSDSKFKSNVDYKIGSGGIDYGLTSFPAIKPEPAKEYIIDTNFTIIPPVNIIGTEDIYTMYGFDDSAPDIIGSGASRYTPNFGELVLFYSHGSKPLNRTFAMQNNTTGSPLITSPLNTYVKTMPFNLGLKSFSWSVLVDITTQIPDTLFLRYYAEIVKRYINQNVMKQEFSLTLTPNEIRDFRLENDIIIGENKFSVIEATIDITKGDTKLTLLNY